MKKIGIIIGAISLLLLSGCGSFFNQPLVKEEARLGEEVFVSKHTRDISPVKRIVVGVYKFKDQTGQYKQVENGVSYSTAVTQGATTILIKALEDSGWFIPIERENISNLLNERQIIRSTRMEESKKAEGKEVKPLSPLLFAGIILEGGIVSYDSNIITGGAGARYFGAGASTQYRQDRITVYLRAVSTSSGRILKTVYVSKTILSQALDVNLFRYVKIKRLLEAEIGISQNEPGQLAVKEAIEKAVESLIMEGVASGLWKAREDSYVVERSLIGYDQEKREAESTALLNRKLENRKTSYSVFAQPYSTYFSGDYTNTNYDLGGQIGYRRYFYGSYLNAGASLGSLTLNNSKVFQKNFLVADVNMEYSFLPYDRLSPYAFLGGGVLLENNIQNPYFKMQYGIGLEYMPFDKIGVRAFTEHSHLFSDEIDNKIHGTHNDTYWVFGLGVNLFLGKK